MTYKISKTSLDGRHHALAGTRIAYRSAGIPTGALQSNTTFQVALSRNTPLLFCGNSRICSLSPIRFCNVSMVS